MLRDCLDKYIVLFQKMHKIILGPVVFMQGDTAIPHGVTMITMR